MSHTYHLCCNYSIVRKLNLKLDKIPEHTATAVFTTLYHAVTLHMYHVPCVLHMLTLLKMASTFKWNPYYEVHYRAAIFTMMFTHIIYNISVVLPNTLIKHTLN